jgi:hypothetical protein
MMETRSPSGAVNVFMAMKPGIRSAKDLILAAIFSYSEADSGRSRERKTVKIKMYLQGYYLEGVKRDSLLDVAETDDTLAQGCSGITKSKYAEHYYQGKIILDVERSLLTIETIYRISSSGFKIHA